MSSMSPVNVIHPVNVIQVTDDDMVVLDTLLIML